MKIVMPRKYYQYLATFFKYNIIVQDLLLFLLQMLCETFVGYVCIGLDGKALYCCERFV